MPLAGASSDEAPSNADQTAGHYRNTSPARNTTQPVRRSVRVNYNPLGGSKPRRPHKQAWARTHHISDLRAHWQWASQASTGIDRRRIAASADTGRRSDADYRFVFRYHWELITGPPRPTTLFGSYRAHSCQRKSSEGSQSTGGTSPKHSPARNKTQPVRRSVRGHYHPLHGSITKTTHARMGSTHHI